MGIKIVNFYFFEFSVRNKRVFYIVFWNFVSVWKELVFWVSIIFLYGLKSNYVCLCLYKEFVFFWSGLCLVCFYEFECGYRGFVKYVI